MKSPEMCVFEIRVFIPAAQLKLFKTIKCQVGICRQVVLNFGVGVGTLWKTERGGLHPAASLKTLSNNPLFMKSAIQHDVINS
jgi:hypothetical protein